MGRLILRRVFKPCPPAPATQSPVVELVPQTLPAPAPSPWVREVPFRFVWIGRQCHTYYERGRLSPPWEKLDNTRLRSVVSREDRYGDYSYLTYEPGHTVFVTTPEVLNRGGLAYLRVRGAL